MRSKQNFRTPEYHPRKLILGHPKRQPQPQKPPFQPPQPPLPRLTTTTNIYLLHPPISLSIAPPSVVAADNSTKLRHPLTLQPYPNNFDLTKFNSTTLAVSYHTSSPFHKLLVLPTPTSSNPNYNDHTLLALHDDGELHGCFPSGTSKKEKVWVKLMRDESFDDVVIFNGKIYALDCQGKVFVVSATAFPRPGMISILGNSLIKRAFDNDFQWRRRLVFDVSRMYLVVRVEEVLFRVYNRVFRKGKGGNWVMVEGFVGSKVLFMARDYYFFMPAEGDFPGREYENCIVFSEGEEYDDIAIFRLSDGTFSREGDNVEFPRINWSLPPWISNASSESCNQYESEPEQDEGLDSNNSDEEEGEVQSIINIESDSDSQDEEDGRMQCDLKDANSKDVEDRKIQEGMESDSESQDEEDGKMQCESDSQENVQETRRSQKNGSQLETKPSEEFSRGTEESAFKSCLHSDIHTTTIYGLHPSADSFPTARSWITAAVHSGLKHELRHPLTLIHHPWKNLPNNFDLSKLRKFTFIHSIFHHITSLSFDKILVVPTPTPTITPKFNGLKYFNYYSNINLHGCTLFALYDGGQLRVCPPTAQEWGRLSRGGSIDKFDDIVIFKGKIYVLDRQGKVYLINICKISRNSSFGKALIDHPVDPGSGRFGWRKRLVVDGKQMYLVVRKEEKLLEVYKMVSRKKVVSWFKVERFDGRQMLFMARDYYFFRQLWALSSFPGMEFENCIVFSEGAFPQYGNGCWEFTNGVVCKREEDLAVFRLDDGTYGREGENGDFPKLNWSPPPWILHVCSGLSAEPQSHSSSESCQSEREPEENEGLDSYSKYENDGEMQSDLIGQDKEQDGMDSDSDSQDQDGKTQCDLNSQENEDKEEVTRSISMNGSNGATEQGTSMKNITQSIPRACTSHTTKSHIIDSVTTKFEGFDVRSDLVPTLQKIWRNHGNIIQNSTVRSGDIVAKALESLATMVRILENNSAQSVSGTQADYISSTLSDLRFMCFKVYWLIPFVEKAVKLHESKHLLDSLNNLSQLSSQFKERRTILFDELAKLDKEENRLEKEMVEVSNMVPFCGQVNFDAPLGSGLT